MPRVTDAVCLGAPVEFDTGPLAAAAASLVSDVAPDGGPPPGAIIAVSVDDQVHFATAGVAQRADMPVAMTWTARTDAGSITKIVATVASLMALVDSGQVDVDDPVSRYLPAFDARVTTLRDLLEHRAGLWEWWPLYLSGARAEEAVATAVALPQRYPRGAGRHYSDIGFILLGALVSHVAGEPLTDAVGHLALEPFGLRETRYATPLPGGPTIASSDGDAIERAMVESGVPYPVSGSSRDFSGWRTHVLVGEVNDGNAFHAFDGAAGHAGLFTTASDLLTFARRMLASCHGDGPVRRETARQFVAAGADPGQALGFRIWRDGSSAAEIAIGHTGFPGVGFAMLPDRRAAAVMVTNRLHAPGGPRATEPMWQLARAAARNQLDQHRIL